MGYGVPSKLIACNGDRDCAGDFNWGYYFPLSRANPYYSVNLFGDNDTGNGYLTTIGAETKVSTAITNNNTLQAGRAGGTDFWWMENSNNATNINHNAASFVVPSTMPYASKGLYINCYIWERSCNASVLGVTSPGAYGDTDALGTSAPTPFTSTDSTQAWATAVVFSVDRVNITCSLNTGSTKMCHRGIWWHGAGGLSNQSNHLGLSLAGDQLIFAFGKDAGGQSVFVSDSIIQPKTLYGVYIAYEGGPGVLGELHDNFTLKLVNLTDGSVSDLSGSWQVTNNIHPDEWHGTFMVGYSGYLNNVNSITLDNAISGVESAYRNYLEEGTIYTLVATTLILDQTQSDTEIAMMVRNPVDWLNTYKVGQQYQYPNTNWSTSELIYNNFQIGQNLNCESGCTPANDSARATWVFLFGNGPYDQYSEEADDLNSHTGIPNYVSWLDSSEISTGRNSFRYTGAYWLYGDANSVEGKNAIRIRDYLIPTYQQETYNWYENQITLAGEVYKDSDFTAFTGGNKRVVTYAVLPRQKSSGQYYSDFIPINAQSYLSTQTSLDYCSAFGGSCDDVSANSSQIYTAIHLQGGTNYGTYKGFYSENFSRNPLHRISNNSNEPWAMAITFNASTDTSTGSQHRVKLFSQHNYNALMVKNGKLIFNVGTNECYNTGPGICFTSTHNFNDGKWHAIYVDYDGGDTTGSDAGSRYRLREVNLITGEVTDIPGTWRIGTGGTSSAISTSRYEVSGTGQWNIMIGHSLATTLKQSYTVSDTEIVKMLLDPVGWVNDYKVNQTYRREGDNSTDVYTFSLNDAESAFATLLYLMGDGGTNDWTYGYADTPYSENSGCYLMTACYGPDGTINNYIYPDQTETQIPFNFSSLHDFPDRSAPELFDTNVVFVNWSVAPSANNWMADSLDPATNADILTSRFYGTTNEVPEGSSLWYQVFNPGGKGVGLWAQISHSNTSPNYSSLLNVVISQTDYRKNNTLLYSPGDTGLGMTGSQFWSFHKSQNGANDLKFGASPIACASSADNGCFWGNNDANIPYSAMITTSDPYASGNMNLSTYSEFSSGSRSFNTGTFDQAIVAQGTFGNPLASITNVVNMNTDHSTESTDRIFERASDCSDTTCPLWDIQGNEPWAVSIVFKRHDGTISDSGTYGDILWSLDPNFNYYKAQLWLTDSDHSSPNTVGFQAGRFGSNHLKLEGTYDFEDGKWYGIYFSYNGDGGGWNNSFSNRDYFSMKVVDIATGEITELTLTPNYRNNLGYWHDGFDAPWRLGGATDGIESMGLASHIITTLKQNETQSDAEIIMMMQDPILWVATYKVGKTFRDPESVWNNNNNFALNDDDSAEATQVYLFDTSNSQYATFTDTDPGHTLTVYNYIKAISGSELVYDSPNGTTYDIANMWNPVTDEAVCCGDNVNYKSLNDLRNTTEEFPVRNFYLSTASSYSGFFAGLMQYPQASDTNDPLASVRSNSTLATFAFDSTNDDVQVVAPLTVSAFPSNNYTSTWGSAVDTGSLTLKFGDADNSEAHSAYISKEMFGAMLQDDGAQIDSSAGGSGNLAGVMVSYNTLDKKDSTLFPDGREMPNTAYSTLSLIHI